MNEYGLTNCKDTPITNTTAYVVNNIMNNDDASLEGVYFPPKQLLDASIYDFFTESSTTHVFCNVPENLHE